MTANTDHPLNIEELRQGRRYPEVPESPADRTRHNKTFVMLEHQTGAYDEEQAEQAEQALNGTDKSDEYDSNDWALSDDNNLAPTGAPNPAGSLQGNAENMSDETLTSKQMDAADEMVAQHDAAAIQQNIQQARDGGSTSEASEVLPGIRVTVLKAGEVVFSEAYPAKVEGDIQAAFNDAVAKARKKTELPPWGWSVSVDKP